MCAGLGCDVKGRAWTIGDGSSSSKRHNEAENGKSGREEKEEIETTPLAVARGLELTHHLPFYPSIPSPAPPPFFSAHAPRSPDQAVDVPVRRPSPL